MRIRESKGCFNEMKYEYALWCAVYVNRLNGSIVEITHGVDSFSRESYNGLIQSMFIDACGGWECRNLSTTVYDHSGKSFCTIEMLTYHDGSEIWAKVYVNGQWVRDMIIAQ